MALAARVNRLPVWRRLVATTTITSMRSASSHEVAKGEAVASEVSREVDKFVDVETHTGQKFEKDDYRLSRFIGGKTKLVNTRFAINLVDEIPPTAVKGRYVSCDGGGGPLGHPKVFINLDQPGNHACGYCGLRFFQEHTEHH